MDTMKFSTSWKNFKPYRSHAEYFLTSRWEGLSCTELATIYEFTPKSSLQALLQMYFDEGAFFEVRIIDLDDIDAKTGQPKVAQRWLIEGALEVSWKLFRYEIDKYIKRSKVK